MYFFSLAAILASIGRIYRRLKVTQLSSAQFLFRGVSRGHSSTIYCKGRRRSLPGASFPSGRSWITKSIKWPDCHEWDCRGVLLFFHVVMFPQTNKLRNIYVLLLSQFNWIYFLLKIESRPIRGHMTDSASQMG